jgi:hypothetical protein
MVESNINISDLKIRIFEELIKSPCYNYDISSINWANIESYQSFKELFETISIQKDIKDLLYVFSKRIFEIIYIDNQMQKSIWFYKYFFCLFLTDPSKESYKEIKKDLIQTCFDLCKKDNDEGVFYSYKLLLILMYLSIGANAIVTITILTRVFDIEFKNSTFSNEEVDIDFLSQQFAKAFEISQNKIRNLLPDYYSKRAFTKIALKLSSIFGDKLYLPFSEQAEKYEFSSDKILDDMETYKGFYNFTSEELITDYSKTKWIYKLSSLSKQELDDAAAKFMELDLQDVVISSSLDFSTHKMFKEIYDSDSD